MKKILFFTLAIIAVSCGNDRRTKEAADITGEWKTLQMKPTPKEPIRDLGNCEGDTVKWKGNIYTFKDDGSFSTKDICSGQVSKDTKCKWKYDDNVLTLNYNHEGEDVKMVFSVTDMDDGNVKFSHIFTRWASEVLDYPNYYYVMQKQ